MAANRTGIGTFLGNRGCEDETQAPQPNDNHDGQVTCW
jgi:hypothetical protein